ncbi:ras guanine nucleotide exchange factor domain-containing protein [Phycomyces blakesleeanus]
MLRPFATDVVNAIRTILVTSGTIDKEAPHIKLNPIVRTHHRTMMASMSKLVLSSKLTYDLSPDEISKVLSESNDLLNNVQNFIHSCQDIGVAVQHMDPKIVPSDHTILRHHRKSEAGHDYPRVKYALQKDLAESLETYGTSMHESIDAILTSLRPVHPESRVSLAALLFTQFRNLSNQTGQFLGIVEDVDLSTVSKSLLIPTLYESQRALSDRLGFLFYYMQVLTDENTPLSTTVEHVVSAAENIGDPIKTICDCIGKLVLEAKETESISIAGTAGTAGNVLRENHLSNERSLVESVILEADESIELEDVDNDVNADANSNADADADVNIDNVDVNQKAPSEALGGLVMQRSQTTPDTPSKKSAKLKKFFGDDAPAAAAAAAKPAVNERPWFLHYDYDVNEIVYNMEGYVKGGSLPALVERLTLHDFLDMNFINTFLLTYRSFCTSMELLNLLEARYNLEPPPGLSEEDLEVWTQKKLKLVRLRVFNVLKNWLELFYNEEDHIILDQLSKFIDTRIRSTLSFSCDQLERLIRKRKESESHGGLKKMTLSLPDPPEPILPRNRKKFRLLDIEPLEMARQLTIMDFKLYSSIRPVECLDKAWSRDTNDENGSVAVNIRASIEYCNQITAWVSEAILSQSDIKKRSAYIKYWVHVAEKCRLLNNFNTCMAVLSAFDNSSVGRLKRTWDMVGARTNLTLSQIRKLMGANRNFTEYRAMIHSINPPCIPFLGIYLQDLTFIEDGNANYLKKTKELINFAKRAKTAEVIREIQQYQSSLYQLKPVEELQSFIQGSLRSTRDEDQLYKESLKLEPREREDEKIARLLQESGFL